MKKAAAAPTAELLAVQLGATKALWDELLAAVNARALTREWKHYGEKHGWQLKVSSGKRAVLYAIPDAGCFRAALALREDVVAKLRGAGLPDALVAEIEAAKRYAEGRPARVVVRTRADLQVVEALVALKLAPAAARDT